MLSVDFIDIIKACICLLIFWVVASTVSPVWAEDEKPAASSDYSKVYILISNDSKNIDGQKICDALKDITVIGGLFDVCTIKDVSEADRMECGFLLLVSVSRLVNQDLNLRDRLSNIRFFRPASFVDFKFKLMKVMDGKWKKVSNSKISACINSCKGGVSVDVQEQLGIILLNSCLKLKCRSRGTGESVAISGKVTNNLPFDVMGVIISAPITPSFPGSVERIGVTESLKVDETKDFKMVAPSTYRYESDNCFKVFNLNWNKAYIVQASRGK